jgi:DNA (cytosine-5)-methyltransferase 1
MARAAEVLQPKYVIIENVQGIMHDSRNVLQRTIESLKSLGYYVSDGLVETVTIGVPQKRRRHIVVASIYPLHKIVRSMFDAVAPIGRDVEWAIGDLRDAVPTSIIDQPSTPSKANLSRIDYLHKHDLFDLPNEQRPPCHRDKVQTYNSVYGRLRWDNPAQTMTSGFYSMCMGRYVHPEKRRTLTAHEAARLQFFPDFFKFESAGTRTAIAKLIGNAVPMKLSYVLLRELFSEHEH